MGLLDWLTGRRRHRLGSFVVWIDADARRAGFVEAVRKDLDAGLPVLLSAHFPETLVQAGTDLAANGIEIEPRDRWSDADCDRWLRSRPTRLLAVPVHGLPAPAPGDDRPARREGPAAAMHFADVHVLAAENERAMRFVATLPRGSTSSIWLSFDEQPLAAFAQPWMKTMMTRMGLDADQSIRSGMVDRAIEKSVQKLERKATGNAAAGSLAQWIDRNVRA